MQGDWSRSITINTLPTQAKRWMSWNMPWCASISLFRGEGDSPFPPIWLLSVFIRHLWNKGFPTYLLDAVTSAITHFRGLSVAIYLQVLENEFNITGLEGVGFIISITIALSDTKLSFKHPNDTLKFNEIFKPCQHIIKNVDAEK